MPILRHSKESSLISIRGWSIIPLLLLLITPLIFSRQLIMGIFFAKYFWTILISFILILLMIAGLKKQGLTRADWLVIVFAFYIFAQAFLSGVWPADNRKLDYFFIAILTYFGIKQLSVAKNLQAVLSLLITIFATTIVTIVYGILQKIHLIAPLNSGFEVTGTFFQPAAFAGFLAAVFPLAFYTWYITRKSNIGGNARLLVSTARITSATSASLIILILPSVQSRSSFVALAAGLIFLLCSISEFRDFAGRLMEKRRGWKLLVISGSILIVLIAGYRMRTGSAKGRLLVWKISEKTVISQPVFGFGTDAFRYVYPDTQMTYFKSGAGSEDDKLLSSEVNAPFNEIIQCCCEWGIMGLILLTLILAAVFRGTGSIKKEAQRSPDFVVEPILARDGPVAIGAKAALISLVVFGQFSYPFSLPELTIYFFVFLALADGHSPEFTVGRIRKVPVFVLPVFIVLLSTAIITRLYPAYKTWQGVMQWDKAIEEPDPAAANMVFRHTFPLLKNNDLFLSDFAHNLFKLGLYRESAAMLDLKKGKSYNDLLLNGEICEQLSMQDTAVQYYKNASFLLPHRFLPLYRLMHLYAKNGDLFDARPVAQEILAKPVKIESYEVYVFRKEARSLLQKEK